jgi:type II secretory pathway component PulK
MKMCLHTSRQGSVMIITLWAMIILMILAIGIKGHVDAHLLAAEVIHERSQAVALVHSGIELSIWMCLADTNNWDGYAESWSQPGIHRTDSGKVTWLLDDESARLNINSASRDFMRTLFGRIGDMSQDQADNLAAAIIDWRDENSDPLVSGGEMVWIDGRNSSKPAPNKSFRSIYEVMFLPGMSDDLFRQLHPYITIYGLGRLNLNTVTDDMLVSLALSLSPDSDGIAQSLAAKVLNFRNQKGSFRDVDWKTLSVQLGLNAEETLLVRNMLDKLTVRTHYLRGRASADFRETGQADAGVEYIFNKDSGQIVSWYEY